MELSVPRYEVAMGPWESFWASTVGELRAELRSQSMSLCVATRSKTEVFPEVMGKVGASNSATASA